MGGTPSSHGTCDPVLLASPIPDSAGRLPPCHFSRTKGSGSVPDHHSIKLIWIAPPLHQQSFEQRWSRGGRKRHKTDSFASAFAPFWECVQVAVQNPCFSLAFNRSRAVQGDGQECLRTALRRKERACGAAGLVPDG